MVPRCWVLQVTTRNVVAYSFCSLAAAAQFVLSQLHRTARDKKRGSGSVTVDLASRTVTRGADRVRLTPTEWQVLELLVRNPGRLVTRHKVPTEIWGSDHVADSGYERLYIAQLRKKLEPDPSDPRHILTDAGMGCPPAVGRSRPAPAGSADADRRERTPRACRVGTTDDGLQRRAPRRAQQL